MELNELSKNALEMLLALFHQKLWGSKVENSTCPNLWLLFPYIVVYMYWPRPGKDQICHVMPFHRLLRKNRKDRTSDYFCCQVFFVLRLQWNSKWRLKLEAALAISSAFVKDVPQEDWSYQQYCSRDTTTGSSEIRSRSLLQRSGGLLSVCTDDDWRR